MKYTHKFLFIPFSILLLNSSYANTNGFLLDSFNDPNLINGNYISIRSEVNEDVDGDGNLDVAEDIDIEVNLN